MVFFIPFLLVIAGAAICKEREERKLAKRNSRAKVPGRSTRTLPGRGAVYYDAEAIDTKLHVGNGFNDAPPSYEPMKHT